MYQIFSQITPFFLLIGLGWCIFKLKIGSTSWLKPLGDFAFFIGFPALIFSNLTAKNIDYNLIEGSFLRLSSLLFGTLVLLFVFLKKQVKSNQMKATLIICFLFGNAAFLGIPLVTKLNPDMAQVASLNASIMLFWVFSIGLILAESYTKKDYSIKRTLYSLVKNPLLLSVVFGISFSLGKFSIPELIQYPIKMVGEAVTPLVMIMIGLFVASQPPPTKERLKHSFIFSIFKLFVFPLLGLVVFSLFNKQELSSLVQFAMPTAITPFILAERYELDQTFISNSIIISTLLSFFTIPVIIYLFNFVSI